MRSVFMAILIASHVLGSCACSGDENDELAQIVRVASDERQAWMTEGAATYRRSWVQHQGKQELHVSGTIEWAPDYLYFDGIVKEQLFVGSRTQAVVKVLRQGTQFVARLDCSYEAPSKAMPSTTFYRLQTLERTPLVRYAIDPQLLFESVDLGTYRSPLSALRNAGESSPHLVRAVTTEKADDGEFLRVSMTFPHNIRVTYLFDLSRKGLCTEYLSERDVSGGRQYQVCKREWQPFDADHWMPVRATSVARLGSMDGTLRATTELEVSEYRRTYVRTQHPPVDPEMWGPLPDNNRIWNQDADGRLVEEEESRGRSRPDSFESELRSLGENLRGKDNPNPSGNPK